MAEIIPSLSVTHHLLLQMCLTTPRAVALRPMSLGPTPNSSPFDSGGRFVRDAVDDRAALKSKKGILAPRAVKTRIPRYFFFEHLPLRLLHVQIRQCFCGGVRLAVPLDAGACPQGGCRPGYRHEDCQVDSLLFPRIAAVKDLDVG